ncbi:hypothetical protein D3C78_1362010 [compost metagenome]
MRISFCCGVGWNTPITALHTSTANSGSVELKISGEYSKRHSVSGFCSARRLMICPALTAIWITPAWSWLKTMRRKLGAVAL